ncbi:MAG: hypothetical protein U0528_07970 [Anaerolineae bacterium]
MNSGKMMKTLGKAAVFGGSLIAGAALMTALVAGSAQRLNAPALGLVQLQPRRSRKLADKYSYRAYLIAKRWFDIVVSATAILFLPR